MKFRGNVTGAIISLAVFLAFAIAGGICLASGFGELVANSDVINNVDDIVEYVDNFGVNVDLDGMTITNSVDDASAYYERVLSKDMVEGIVIKSAAGSVTVTPGSKLSVKFTGRVSQGKYDQLNEVDVPISDVYNFEPSYYEHDGIIDASISGKTLTIEINSAASIVGINNDLGAVTVTIPEDYTGSLEFKGGLGEMNISGLSLSQLVLDGCLGEVDMEGCKVERLTVNSLMGELDTDRCEVCAVDFKSIAGEINLESTVSFADDSTIEDIMGEVNIDLPLGTQLNITQNDILGDVGIDRAITGSADAPGVEIEDVMGEVTIELGYDD